MAGLIRQDRDLRVDVFRGLSLWVIFVNHIPGNVLGDYTPRNYVFADATETFVLLAGYAAGLAYGITMDRQGWFFAASRVMGRVFTLYVAHIFLLVVFTAQVGYSAARLDAAVYLDEMHLDPFSQEPYRALLEALLLRYQPSFLNILPLYIVLLAMFALAMPLLRRTWLMLGASFALYAVVRLTGLSLPAWRGEGGWFFNPLAWQALFFIGCALGYRPRPAGGQPAPAPAAGPPPLVVPYRRWLVALCVLLLAFGAVAVLLIQFREGIVLERLPAVVARFLAGIDKTGMHPMRLASMLALTYLFAHATPQHAAWLRGRMAAPFALMGQQALPVFCAGIFLSFLGRVALEISDRWPMQLLVNLAGLVAMVALAALTAWYAGEKRATRGGGGGGGRASAAGSERPPALAVLPAAAAPLAAPIDPPPHPPPGATPVVLADIVPPGATPVAPPATAPPAAASDGSADAGAAGPVRASTGASPAAPLADGASIPLRSGPRADSR